MAGGAERTWLPWRFVQPRVDVLWIVRDFVEVDELSQMIVVGRGGIDALDQTFGASLLVIH